MIKDSPLLANQKEEVWPEIDSWLLHLTGPPIGVGVVGGAHLVGVRHLQLASIHRSRHDLGQVDARLALERLERNLPAGRGASALWK
jgi:hypothetical protein